MLYPKAKDLDFSNLTELRMLKMEEQRQISLNLLSNISKYANALTELSTLENRISEDIFTLYTTDSVYSELLHKMSKAMLFKTDIMKKNVSTLKDLVEKSQKLEGFYDSLKPLFINYFTSLKTLSHYETKVPKVINIMESRKKAKGQLSTRETDKLVRNKRKLENAKTDLKVISECIVAETDMLNLKRFDTLNPLVREFIGSHMSIIYLMSEKWSGIKNFEQILSQSENEQFNDRYFLDIQKKMRSRMMKDNADKMAMSAEVKKQQIMNQNVQNNYYYINQDPQIKKISQFNLEDDSKEANKDEKPELVSLKGQMLGGVKKELDAGIDYPSECEINGFGNRIVLPLMYR